MLSIINIIMQSFKMSLQNIVGNKMRSFLTMLGIIIGVASVIGLITIVQGATDSIIGEFSSLGTGTLSVTAMGDSMKKGLTEADIQDLREVDGVAGIAPSVSLTTKAVFNEEVYKNVSIDGEDVVYFEQNDDIIKAGRQFNANEMNGDTMVCIVDSTFIEKVMLGHQVIGNKIKLCGYTYTIIGVKKDDDSMFSLMDTSDSNGTITIPYKNALTMSGAQNVSSLTVYVADTTTSDALESKLRAELDKIFNNSDNAYSVISMDSLMDTMEEITGMMSALLAGIASIALLVGGIGIMNMMLVSVSERTKEIGLRKALGAEPARIQFQFLIESIVLSLVGGIIGIGFGLLIAFVGAKLMNTQFVISSSAIILGVGFSIGVGVLFGWMPAKRASELNPIDALRSE